MGTLDNHETHFTPGPWKVMPGDRAPRICVEGDKEWPIVVTISGHSKEGIKANERLIAGAPRLVLAVEAFVLSRNDEDAMRHDKLSEMINALAACKAGG